MPLYHTGLSYEKAGVFVGASYEAVREWYQKGMELFEASIMKKKRKRIAVDEKEITINGTTIFIWVLLILMMRKYWPFGYHLEEVVWKQKYFSKPSIQTNIYEHIHVPFWYHMYLI
ncbi:hypothetical protein METP1_00870 [Methanosarcinales archaeon]|nr:hypothetical protein METP1_00870 [Methanosarcinales archaeon]